MSDKVNHPEHYTQHPSGVECIQVVEHMGFCVGNAIKYLWRHEMKGGIEDLEKARWYVDREIKRLKGDDWNGQMEEFFEGFFQDEPSESKAPSDSPY